MKIITTIFLLLILISPVFTVSAGCRQDSGSDGVCIENPLGGDTTPQVLIGKVISAILGLVGSLALLMFIYGGLVWMTAAGASEKVQKGKDILVWAAIGMIVIFSSYAMVRFVLVNVIQGKP
jgi:hypothetical protein